MQTFIDRSTGKVECLGGKFVRSRGKSNVRKLGFSPKHRFC
jgi:hypothetical protein